MIKKTIEFAAVGPRETIRTEAAAVSIPSVAGEAQILPGHAEAFFLLKKGSVVVEEPEGGKRVLSVEGGICRFRSGRLVVIL